MKVDRRYQPALGKFTSIDHTVIRQLHSHGAQLLARGSPVQRSRQRDDDGATDSQTNIFNAFKTFVAVHQELLSILIGKRGIISVSVLFYVQPSCAVRSSCCHVGYFMGEDSLLFVSAVQCLYPDEGLPKLVIIAPKCLLMPATARDHVGPFAFFTPWPVNTGFICCICYCAKGLKCSDAAPSAGPDRHLTRTDLCCLLCSQNIPFAGQGIAAALRAIENVVDTIAYGLIDTAQV